MVTSTVSCGRTFTTLGPYPPGHYMRSGVTSEAGIFFHETGIRAAQNIIVFASMPEIWSRSRSTLPRTRIGAASPSYSEPEPRSQRMFPQTPKSESELSKILDLATAGIKISPPPFLATITDGDSGELASGCHVNQ